MIVTRLSWEWQKKATQMENSILELRLFDQNKQLNNITEDTDI